MHMDKCIATCAAWSYRIYPGQMSSCTVLMCHFTKPARQAWEVCDHRVAQLRCASAPHELTVPGAGMLMDSVTGYYTRSLWP